MTVSKKTQQQRAERAAAILRERQRKQRRRQVLSVAGVLLAIIALVAGGFLIQSLRDDTGKTLTSSDVPAGTTDTYGVVVGDADAPTTVTVYEDFQCPICKEFEKEVGVQLQAAAADGKVRIDYRMVSFLDRASTDEYSSRALNAAAVVLDASGVDVFMKFHTLLFENQPAEGGAGLSDDELVRLAVQAGATEADVRAGIDDKVFEDWVTNSQDEMSKNGVNGTPSVFVDGTYAGKTFGESVDAVKQLLG